MSKKNTRKRLLAGALATVMMLTMCPSWALADDDYGIATLPAIENSMPVVDFAPTADPIETPDVPSSSETEAPAEDQNTAPAPSDDGANGDTDVAESGNSTNSTVSEDSENNSQNDNAASNAPENEIASQDAPTNGAEAVDVYAQKSEITAQAWVTNRPVSNSNLRITKDIVSDDNGTAVTALADAKIETKDETYVFWQARVLDWRHQQTEGADIDRTKDGTEIDRIRYVSDWHGYYYHLEYHDKQDDSWKSFDNGDQLVFYYLIRTDYSEMVQIDVSDWTVDKEPSYDARRSVTYQVIVDGGNDDGKVLDSKKFWYNKTFTVSSVRVRQTESENYTIKRVELDPTGLGTVNNDDLTKEYQFSLDLSAADRDNATVKIYVEPKVQPHQLTYVLNEGTIASAAGTYTAAGLVYPDAPVITPAAEKADCVFDGWYTNEELTQKWTGKTMPNDDLTLYACFTQNQAPNPNPEPKPETTYPAKYFILLPNRGVPEDNSDQGQENYLPSRDYDGGVSGLTQATGYKGSLTQAGMNAVPKVGNSVTNIAEGVSESYLNVPSDLGFFTASNWGDNGYSKDTNVKDIASLLGEGFNGTGFEIVWYTIKNQAVTDGSKYNIHVDGYLKGVDVNVTYHSNFGDDVTDTRTAKTGEIYNAVSYETLTTLPNRAKYEFTGWYTDKACNQPYTAKLLMSSMDLYAGWEQTAFDVSYFYKNDQNEETQFGTTETYEAKSDVTVKTAHPEKEGYTFTGWENIANIVSVDKDGHFEMPAQDVRFDATFKINKYNVTWKSEGTVLGTQEVDYNTKPTNTYEPTKADDAKFSYTFKGWKVEGGDDTLVIPTEIAVTRLCQVNCVSFLF